MKNIIIEKEYSINNKNRFLNLSQTTTTSIGKLNIIAENCGLNQIKRVNQYFEKIKLNLNCDAIKWEMLLSEKNKKEYMNYLKTEINNLIEYDTGYFDAAFLCRKKLLDEIKPLKAFDLPVYKHDSATGRSRIVSGTNYMTLAKEKRKKLESTNGMRVFEIDFTSCEPYFYLTIINKIKKSNIDIYEKIKNDLSLNLERAVLKRCVISIMYGAGYPTIKRLSKMKKSDYEKMIDYFNIESFSNSLKKELSEIGYIKNRYGRPVVVKNERSILNYYVQSSAADFCYIAFQDFISKNQINFHAIIHDAIICSSSNNEIEKIKKIISLKCPITSIEIPIKLLVY